VVKQPWIPLALALQLQAVGTGEILKTPLCTYFPSPPWRATQHKCCTLMVLSNTTDEDTWYLYEIKNDLAI